MHAIYEGSPGQINISTAHLFVSLIWVQLAEVKRSESEAEKSLER